MLDWIAELRVPLADQLANQLPDYQIIQLPDSRVPSAIGRSARLEIDFEVRRGRTIVAHAYAEPPYHVSVFDAAGAVYVMIVCSGPGVFAGDAWQQSVRVGPGARAVLTSQTALQVHPGDGPPALVRHTYRLDPGAELHCHWDPVIPFAGASLSQQFDIEADASSRLYWSDALMAGRLSRGEAWRFERVAHELRLRIGGPLAYLERFQLTAGDRAFTMPWLAGGAGYFATMLVKHPNAQSETAEALHRRFAVASARMAVDALEQGLIAARVVASNGTVFRRVRREFRHATAESIFHQPDLLARK